MDDSETVDSICFYIPFDSFAPFKSCLSSYAIATDRIQSCRPNQVLWGSGRGDSGRRHFGFLEYARCGAPRHKTTLPVVERSHIQKPKAMSLDIAHDLYVLYYVPSFFKRLKHHGSCVLSGNSVEFLKSHQVSTCCFWHVAVARMYQVIQRRLVRRRCLNNRRRSFGFFRKRRWWNQLPKLGENA